MFWFFLSWQHCSQLSYVFSFKCVCIYIHRKPLNFIMASDARLEIQKCYETFKEQALGKNNEQFAIWSKYKSDLNETKNLLNFLPKKVSHDVMVPIGNKALMRGKIVHTNEFLVNLGETWFVKRTAYQSLEICDRRIKTCNEMLAKLEKERELILNKTSVPAEQEAFGSEERPEIVEFVTEEEHERWNKEHRDKEKKYRQQLAELRNKEKKPIKTEEDLWKHLDELELQEELEDELNRLHAEASEEEEDEEEEENVESNQIKNISTSSQPEKVKTVSESKPKRKVSFACDLDSSNDEPIVIHITHSKVEVESSNTNNEINSPRDIYDQYLISIKKNPIPVLKSQVNPNREKELKSIHKNENYYSDDEKEDKESTVEVGLLFKDVTEKKPFTNNFSEFKPETNKKISKFKASRMNQ